MTYVFVQIGGEGSTHESSESTGQRTDRGGVLPNKHLLRVAVTVDAVLPCRARREDKRARTVTGV